MPIDFEAVVKARTGRNKVTLQVLGGDTPPNQLTQVSVTTATSDSVSLLPNTSMPQVLAHALRTPLPTPCKSTGRDMTAIFPIGSACDRFIPAIPRLRIGGISSITACFGWAIFLQESYSRPKQKFSSGRELINAVKTRREDAQRFKELSQGVEAELAGTLDQYDPDLIQGVRVLWVREGRAARDETAFRHALKAGHRLRQAGQRMTDAAIIDTYEQGYRVAQEVGADGRKNELPPMKDRQTMARRVREYVTTSKSESYGSSAPSERATLSVRHCPLWGVRAVKRPMSAGKAETVTNAQAELKKLETANKRRRTNATGDKFTIAGWFMKANAETGE